MSRISGADTGPEIAVRKIIHRMGFRCRLHVKKLPGNPDIVLARHKMVIFVNGCFWHGHRGCKRSKRPSSNIEFWNEKISKTIKRDKEAILALKSLGWKVLVVWQCQTKNLERLHKQLSQFLIKEKI